MEQQLSQVDQLEEGLQAFSRWAQAFASTLHTPLLVNLTGLPPARAEVEVLWKSDAKILYTTIINPGLLNHR